MEVKEMNTKEAIEFLRSERDDYGYPIIRESYDKVISLLQQLDKYQQMWEELKDRNMCSSRPDGQYLDDEDFEELEQKYFPKGVKK